MSDSEDVTLRNSDIITQLQEKIKALETQLLHAGITPYSPLSKSTPDLSRAKRSSLPACPSRSTEEILNPKRQSSCTGKLENAAKNQTLSTYDKRSGTTDFGKQYEYIMCAYYAVRFATSDKVSDFEMTTNHEIYGDFDDIALKVKYVDGSTHTYLLQLKHTENKKRLTENNLAAEKKDFSVMKYLKTFQILEEHKNVSCILFTNRTAYFKEGSQFSLNDFEVVVKEQARVSCEELLDTNQTSKRSIFQFSTLERNEETVEIGKFLNQFYLLANQNSVSKMTTVITELLKEMLQRDVYNTFIHFMKNWWGGNFVLTKNDVIEKLAELTLSPCIRYISDGEYNERSQILKEAILKFDITLVQENDIDILSHFWYDDLEIREISLMALKYGLTNKGISSLNELTEEQRSKVMWYLNKVPLIVRVHDFTKESIKCAIKLLERMEVRKKILLLGNFSKEDFPEWRVFDNLSDLLDDNLYETIIKNFEVSLQGRSSILLETLLNSQETAKIIGIKELFIMTQGPLLIGNQKVELPESYISRTVSTTFLDTEKVITKCINSNELLIINATPDFGDYLKNRNLHYIELTDDETEVESSIILATKCTKMQFDSICCKTFKHKVHLIQIVDDACSILVLSSDNNLKSEELKYQRKSIEEGSIHEMFDNPINVLCAQPGIGKSTMIKYLDNNCPPDYWSVRVNLRKFNYLLREEPEEEEILLHFLELDGLTQKSLVNEIKLLFVKNRKIYLFLDGLDEIESNCVHFALDYVNYIASTGVHVWISSRQNLQEVITTRLNIFPIDIQELNKNEQKNYIQKRLQRNYTSGEIEEISKEIFRSADVANSHNMLGIPLQLYIITENFLDDVELYHKLSEEVFVLTKMYKIFFDGKKKHQYEKVGVQYEQQLGFNFNLHLENYEIPALRCCLDDNAFRSLNLEENLKNREFLETIKSEGDKYGIITQINDEDRAVFAHQTYAEYFACLWLKKNFDKARILQDEFRLEKYQNLKLIFDILLAENCPLHLAVIYRNSDQVKKHLPNIASRDEGGRSALHLICSYGSKYVPLQLEQSLYSNDLYHDENNFNGESSNYRKIFADLSQCDPFMVDKVFMWNSLDYCFHYQSLYPIEKFLEQYDDAVKLDHILDSLNSVSIAYYSSKLGYPYLLEAVLRRNRSVINYRIGEAKLSFLHVAVKGVGENSVTPTYATTVKIIKILIKYGIDVNGKDKNGATALHLAVSQGHYDIVKALLDEGAEINATDNKEQTIIHYVLDEWEEQVKTLKIDSSDFDISAIDKNGTSLLHWACKENDCYFVKHLLDKGIDINIANSNGETALHYAVRTWKPDTEIIELLAKSGADVNSSDNLGISPLHWAFDKGYYDIIGVLHRKGAKVTTITIEHKTILRQSYKPLNPNMQMVEMLMDYGFNVNLRNGDGVSVLHWASEKGHIGTLKLLIANGANVNATTRNKETILHYVARGWNTRLVKMFIEIGIDINARDINGTTPLHRAAEYGHFDMVKVLMDNGANITSKTNHGESVLNFAVKAHEPNLEIINLLLQEGIDVNGKDQDGITALHWASERGHCETVKLLINWGANVNCATEKGETPIHYTNPCLDMIKLLLANDIDVNAKDVDGMTALHWASERGQFDLVKILVNSGSDINAVTNEEETILIYALKQRRVNIEVIKFLINNSKDINAIDKRGMNALHWASGNGHYDVVKLLLEKGVDVNSCTNKGETMLHHASRSWNSNTDIIKRLIQNGVAVNAVDGDGTTALHWACKDGHYTNVEILVELGADVSMKTKNEETVAHFAANAWKNNERVLELLIGKGVDVNDVDKQGKTALHWAAEKGFYDNVKLLIDKGAVVDAVTRSNLTALHLAVYGGHVRIIKLLLEKGLDINKVDAKNGNLPLYFAMRHGNLKEDLLVMMAATIREKFPLLSWTRYSYQEVITYLQEAQPYLEIPQVMKHPSTSMSEQSATIFGSLQQVISDRVGPYTEWLRNLFSSLNCRKKGLKPRTPTFIVHYPVFPTDEICKKQNPKTPTIDRSFTF